MLNLGAQKLVVALKRSLGYLGRGTKPGHYNALGSWGVGVAGEDREGSPEEASLQVLEELARQSKSARHPGGRDTV